MGTSQMRETVKRFIKNVSKIWTDTGRLTNWPVGKLLCFYGVDEEAHD